MPESKVRKQAAEKTAAKKKAQTEKKRSDNKAKKARLAAGTRDWVPWVFIPVGLLGVLWLVVYYIAGHMIPFMSDLGGWNVMIGMGCMAAAFAIATLWK